MQLAIIVLTDSTRIVVQAATEEPCGLAISEQHQDRTNGPWLPTRAIWCPFAHRAEFLAAVQAWSA